MTELKVNLEEEKSDLYKKFVALDMFLRSEKGHFIDIQDRMLLETQLHIMQSYLSILKLRIERSKAEFLKETGLTEDQFYGRVEIEGSLNLDCPTSVPEGFNPTVGRSLYLNGLTSIPEGFNPTTGWSLYLNGLTFVPEGFSPTTGWNLHLNSLTSIPEGFNPTVGGNLHLDSLTSIPAGFNPTVGEDLYLNRLTSVPEGFNPTNVSGRIFINKKQYK